VIALADTTAIRNRKHQPEPGDLKTCDRRYAEIRRQLTARKGSPLMGGVVAESLQATAEGRLVLPGNWRSPIYPAQCIADQPHLSGWIQLAWADIDLLGLKQVNAFLLRDNLRIFWIGTLLLFSAEEIRDATDEETLRDVEVCLKANWLRLPTAAELTGVIESGSVLELLQYSSHKPYWSLRIIRDLAPHLPLQPFWGIHPEDFFWEWNHLVTIGDLLQLTYDELEMCCLEFRRRHWQHTRSIWPISDREAVRDAGRVQMWVEMSGLSLAS
jgi:hypothetical protein